MATENPRVWFKSISLENVRSFGTKQTLNFTDKDGNAARWNVILGDNGTGKTTVLKGLFLALNEKYNLSRYSFDFYSLLRKDDLVADVIAETEEYVNEIIIRKAVLSLFISEEAEQDFRADYRTYPVVYSAISENDDPINSVKEREIIPIIYAYGASRRIGESGLSEAHEGSFITLFEEEESLINAEEWLVQADYMAYKNPSLRGKFNLISQTLLRLLREDVTNLMIDTNTGIPKVYLTTHYGNVRLHELSLGYKTLIAWMVDFAKGLFDRYPESNDPLSEPAVCLVDEIDLHLHPKFQRTIIKFLTDTFPNTQFIVTAHSPLIVVAAEERPLDTNIILLKREGDQTVVVNDPIDVSKWSVDQILNSDLFGHIPARSEPLTELRTERDTLLSKQNLTTKQQARLLELDDQIGVVPFGRDQAEVQAETIIQQLANVLRSKQQEP
jgi:energy-coupling factor transporter ATP-binding protein EcfA2